MDCIKEKPNVEPEFSYIGETSRGITARLQSHLTEQNSALKLHMVKCNHAPPTLLILDVANNVNRRKFLEALYIRILSPKLNGNFSTPSFCNSSFPPREIQTQLKRKCLYVLQNNLNQMPIVKKNKNSNKTNNNTATTNPVRRSTRLAAKTKNAL
jgi:hypothetical protein